MLISCLKLRTKKTSVCLLLCVYVIRKHRLCTSISIQQRADLLDFLACLDELLFEICNLVLLDAQKVIILWIGETFGIAHSRRTIVVFHAVGNQDGKADENRKNDAHNGSSRADGHAQGCEHGIILASRALQIVFRELSVRIFVEVWPMR